MWNMLSIQATDWKKNTSEPQKRQALKLLKVKDVPETRQKSRKEKYDIYFSVSASKGYP